MKITASSASLTPTPTTAARVLDIKLYTPSALTGWKIPKPRGLPLAEQNVESAGDFDWEAEFNF